MKNIHFVSAIQSNIVVFVNKNILLIPLLLLFATTPVYAQSDKEISTKNNRILLKIPYEDREGLLHVMRNNLKNLGQMIDSMVDDDFKSVQEIAKNMSFNKKKGEGLSYKGNAAFIAMGVKFHAEDTATVMKAAEKKDRKATLYAMSSMVNTCVACHSMFRVMEWPDNKLYKRPKAKKLFLPKGLK